MSRAMNHTIKCKLINSLQMHIPVKIPEEWRTHLAPLYHLLFVLYVLSFVCINLLHTNCTYSDNKLLIKSCFCIVLCK